MLRSSLKSFNLSETLKEDPIFTKRPEQLSVQAFISTNAKINSKWHLKLQMNFSKT